MKTTRINIARRTTTTSHWHTLCAWTNFWTKSQISTARSIPKIRLKSLRKVLPNSRLQKRRQLPQRIQNDAGRNHPLRKPKKEIPENRLPSGQVHNFRKQNQMSFELLQKPDQRRPDAVWTVQTGEPARTDPFFLFPGHAGRKVQRLFAIVPHRQGLICSPWNQEIVQNAVKFFLQFWESSPSPIVFAAFEVFECRRRSVVETLYGERLAPTPRFSVVPSTVVPEDQTLLFGDGWSFRGQGFSGNE